MWWKKLFAFKQEKAGEPQETKEIYVVAKCIGCGQCEHGCPLKVKIKVPKNQK